MRVGSLFAGVGGFDLAAERIGMDVAWQSEVDKYSCRVLEERFPGVPNLGSVENINGRSTENVELLVGGSPCQGFSVAGVGMGLQDPRSGLIGEMLRVADEMQPEWLVWENVPGALTSSRGQDFANVLAAMTGSSVPLPLPKHPQGRRSRYAGVARGPKGTFAWRVLDARYFGVPQRRSRIIGVRSRDPQRAVDALFDGFVWPDEIDVEREDSWATCLDVDSTPFEWGDAPENPKEVLLRDCLEADPAEYEKFILTAKACEGIIRRATRRGKELPPVLEVALRTTASQEVSADLWERALADLEAELYPPGATGTITTAFTDKNYSNHQEVMLGSVLAEPHARLVETFRKVRRAASTEDFETWEREDAANTLNTYENSDVRATTLAVAHPDPAGNLTRRYSQGVNTTFDDGAVVIGLEDLFVRRLTPRETERLQGFPDDHTLVAKTSASQRFKQMGNAVAVPVAEWAFRRILDVEFDRAFAL